VEKSVSNSSNWGVKKWLVHKFRDNGAVELSNPFEGMSTSLSMTDPITVRIETDLLEAFSRGDLGIALSRHYGRR